MFYDSSDACLIFLITSVHYVLLSAGAYKGLPSGGSVTRELPYCFVFVINVFCTVMFTFSS